MKILIVSDHLGIGGISQSLLNMIYNIQPLNMDIDLQLLRYDEDLLNKYNQLNNIRLCEPIRVLNVYNTSFSNQKNIIDKIIKIFFVCLCKMLGRKRTLDLILYFVPKTKEYDIAISFANDIWTSQVNGFYGGCNDYVLKKVNSKKKIAWIHSDPNKLGLTYEISKKTYQNFDKIVNVSYACKEMFDEIIPEFKHKSEVVYNMFNIKKIKQLSAFNNPYDKKYFNIVTVARLDNHSKRIDKIIDCCKNLKDNGIVNFKWYVIGDGPDGEWLKFLAKKKKVEDVLIFEGKKQNPYPYMKYANIFVLTSDYESYSMVLTEALITGTPVITTNFPSASEIIKNHKNGIIVEADTESIYNAVLSVMKNPYLINKMSNYIKNHQINNEVALKQFKNVIGK